MSQQKNGDSAARRMGFWEAAVSGPDFGRRHRLEVSPIGYVNAAAKFQTIMDKELGAAELDGETTCYIDDLCVHHDDWHAHLAALERMLQMCERTGLRLHPDKCRFGMESVNSVAGGTKW